MDINTFRGMHTIIMIVVFLAICWWAYGKKRKNANDEAAHLPFDDDEIDSRTLNDKKTENK